MGDIPIVASLDHHANVTPRMVRAADGLVGFREHPHTGADIRATGERAARLAVTTLNGAVDPRMAFVRVPMVTTTGLSTTEGPMAALFDRRRQLEADGHDRLVSLCPVQPWLDVPDLGFAALVVSNGDFRSAATGASELARAAWNRRDDFDESFPSVDDAIDRAIHGGGPVVLADRGDVTLGGAPGDSPVVLRRCCDRDDATAVRAAIPIVDPAAVSTVHEAASEPVTLDVGGHFTPEFEPVTVTGRPVFDSPDPLRLAGDYYAGEPIDMGRRIVFRLTDRPIDLILSAKPGVTTDPSFFTDHDIAPNEADLLVVKSIGTFRPGFEPMAGAIMVCDTPGVCGTDLSQFDHRYARPVHPLDEVEPAFEVVAGYRGT